jgi:hypothetical protein
MTATTAINLDRAVCKSCKIQMALPTGTRIDFQQIVPRILIEETKTFMQHDCGNYLRGQRIIAKESTQECGEKCQSATGPACECKCKGENHGV